MTNHKNLTSSRQTIKLRLQLELKLQAKILTALNNQGWFATKTSDRFKAGRPDCRMGHPAYGQLDFELKYSFEEFIQEKETGLTKLQMIKIGEMNRHGMPAVGLIYSEPLSSFFITTVLRDTLPPPRRCVSKLPQSGVVSGHELFEKTMEHLYDLGYHKGWRS